MTPPPPTFEPGGGGGGGGGGHLNRGGGHNICFYGAIMKITLKCLSIGTPKAINFPFISNEKLMFLGVPVFKHIVMRL